MSVPNPFFRYFNDNRETFLRHLFKPEIGTTKIYENVERVILPSADALEMPLSRALTERISGTSFDVTPVPLQALSTLLYWSAGELGWRQDGQGNVEKKVFRPHPSGGGKYPIETYLLIDQAWEHGQGLFHYRPDIHQLELIHELSEPDAVRELKRSFYYDWVQAAPIVVFFSLILERNMPKYGSLAYKLGLIEAGHIAQNVYLGSAALDLHCCALGGLKEARLHELLSIDGYNETLFYAVALGLKPENK